MGSSIFGGWEPFIPLDFTISIEILTSTVYPAAKWEEDWNGLCGMITTMCNIATRVYATVL